MSDINTMLIDFGIDQFVRQITVEVLKEVQGKTENVDDVIKEINIRLMDEFKIKAQKSFEKVLVDIKKLV